MRVVHDAALSPPPQSPLVTPDIRSMLSAPPMSTAMMQVTGILNPILNVQSCHYDNSTKTPHYRKIARTISSERSSRAGQRSPSVAWRRFNLADLLLPDTMAT